MPGVVQVSSIWLPYLPPTPQYHMNLRGLGEFTTCGRIRVPETPRFIQKDNKAGNADYYPPIETQPGDYTDHPLHTYQLYISISHSTTSDYFELSPSTSTGSCYNIYPDSNPNNSRVQHHVTSTPGANMQFTAITALILTMAAGAIAAPPHAVGDRLAVLKRDQNLQMYSDAICPHCMLFNPERNHVYLADSKQNYRPTGRNVMILRSLYSLTSYGPTTWLLAILLTNIVLTWVLGLPNISPGLIEKVPYCENYKR
ncbi:uncharacterized protein RAG0_12268 [Rhynchosporium agropyri]|uniref:Uncharacterized protein n=1 Tax=Rhynchosporium agropyri TaxID=914238 RepID=A0A1E1L7Q1_9HELO|nr:uncharacterized protein RAG0_12268 [Rhynchosporium agropyri]